MANSQIRIGTRGSKLARWQAEWVASQLQALQIDVKIVFIQTSGDVTTGPIGQIGGQGVFTKAIQSALCHNEIDLAVHSLKDLPTEPIDGLTLAAVPLRETIRDAFIGRVADRLENLPSSAVVGTGSTRRQAQLLAARSDITVKDIRGNVETRLQKLDDGQYDAIVLAEAGLKRLGLQNRITELLDTGVLLPAVGQGALGLETRTDDTKTRELLQPLDDPISHQAVLAERTLLHELRGGCLAPVAAWARKDTDRLVIDAAVLQRDGQKRLACRHEGALSNGADVGHAAAADLLAQGAMEIIQSVRG